MTKGGLAVGFSFLINEKGALPFDDSNKKRGILLIFPKKLYCQCGDNVHVKLQAIH